MEWLNRNKVWVGTAALVLVAAYVFYFINGTIAVSMFSNAWFLAVPLVLGAMVGVIGERSGVVNIGIEGQMLVGAFAAFFAAAATQSIVVGVIAGALSGLAMGAFLAFTTVKGQLDQIIAGVVINIIATGITSFYFESGKTIPRGLPNFDVPLLSKIPLIGPVFFSDGPIALFALVIVFVIHVLLFKTKWGLRTRAVGEYPSAADTAGINVIALRLVNVSLAGILAGVAGTYLSMEATSSFERGMSSGRGFLALAILIFGAWRPMRALAAALFFGFMSATASQLQASDVVNIPQQFINLLPYVLTLVVLAAAAGRVRAPGAVGQPFVKGD
ncbi:nucleoside ABC transporter membrane protein [Knoellia remsis]|uniref:Nucleoside ABC transporter membrane protein n=1 Tax=Knoellia remsis TaxID=407159 RepID=A0A2T0TWC0_9MICO|nr:ABC transporter permease [Knoellia remsis]PRY49953.1 nucleoside ABC transporter membrane protein [Knoellia remsis]